MSVKCPDCDGDNIKDQGDGIMSCKNCDLIFDAGPQWRKYNPEDKPSQAPGFQSEPALTSKAILKWQESTRSGNLVSKSILQASEEIERIANEIRVTNSIKESALEIFSSSSKAGIVRGRSSGKVAAAAVYTACRMANIPRTLDEISERTHLNRNELSRLHKLITRKLKLKIYAANTSNFLPRFAHKLAIDDDVEKEAEKIIKIIEKSNYRRGISPAALLGASLYIACKNNKVRRSQLEIAKAVGTSEVTLRNRAKEILSIINPK